MPDAIIYVRIDENGKPDWKRPKDIRKIFYSLRSQAIELIVRPIIGKKSLQQLRYYRGVVLMHTHAAIVAVGNDEWSKDDVHEYLLDRFAPRKEFLDKRTGETELGAVVRTRNMTHEQMSKFMDDICRWVSTFFNYEIPPPLGEDE